jgi:hypothetical protein
MRVNLLLMTVLAVALCGTGPVGCRKAKGPAPVDPHSAEGVMRALQQEAKQLNDAFARKDFQYIHDYTYYFTGIANTLFAKLDADQKQRLRGSFDELFALADQLDHSSGRRHAEATEATLQRLQTVINNLDKQFHEAKPAA